MKRCDETAGDVSPREDGASCEERAREILSGINTAALQGDSARMREEVERVATILEIDRRWAMTAGRASKLDKPLSVTGQLRLQARKVRIEALIAPLMVNRQYIEGCVPHVSDQISLAYDTAERIVEHVDRCGREEALAREAGSGEEVSP